MHIKYADFSLQLNCPNWWMNMILIFTYGALGEFQVLTALTASLPTTRQSAQIFCLDQ